MQHQAAKHLPCLANADGKRPDGQITWASVDPSVQPLVKKYSDFQKSRISPYVRRPVPREGRFAIVTGAGRDAVAAGCAKDESAFLADGKIVWS